MTDTRSVDDAQEHYWREVDRQGRFNLKVHLLQGAVGILGMSFFIPETVLAAYMTTMTDSKFLIGLPAAITGFAWNFPMLFYSYLVQRQKQRLQIALKAGSLVRFAFVGMAASAFIATPWGHNAGMWVFFLSLGLMACTAGGSAMAWQDLLGRTLPPARRGFFFGLRESIAGFAGFLGAVFLSLYLGARTVDPSEAHHGLPSDYALPFALGAGLYFASWYLLTFVREPEWVADGVRGGAWRQYYRDTFLILKNDRNFRMYVFVRCLLGATGIFNIALFASYAIKEFKISTALVAGVFTAMSLLGRTIMGPIAGRVADKRGFKLPLLAGVIMLMVMLILGITLQWFGSLILPAFFVIYFLAGGLGSVIWVATFNLQLDFGPVGDRVRYIALASTLSSPVTLIAAGSSGFLVDSFGYRPVMLAALAVTIAVFFTVNYLFHDPRHLRAQ
jgi:MFS family permease